MELYGSNPVGVGIPSLKNYYDVLQIDPAVSRIQVREAFLRLKKTYSTGSQALYSIMSEEDARLSLAEIEEAFRVLDDDLLRRAYDARLQANGVLQDRRPASAALHHEEESSGRGEGGSAAFDMSESIVPVLTKRAPSLYKISPRLSQPEARARVNQVLEQAHIGDGTVYKRVRLAAGIDIKELYAQIKIIPEYLDALENNDYAKLPAMVYVKGFLRSYLQFIGIPDSQAAITAFMERWQEWDNQNKV